MPSIDDYYNEMQNGFTETERERIITDLSASAENEDTSPAPTHSCVFCETGSYIQSETRRRAPHFCDQCDEITPHTRIPEENR